MLIHSSTCAVVDFLNRKASVIIITLLYINYSFAQDLNQVGKLLPPMLKVRISGVLNLHATRDTELLILGRLYCVYGTACIAITS